MDAYPGPAPEEALEGVAATALGVARARATESDRDDRLFDDPLASRFVAAGHVPRRDYSSLDENSRRAVLAMYHWLVARTRFLDDICADALTSGIAQVVILGAGLDTRGFRLGWPNELQLFELDRMDIFNFKEHVLDQAGAQPTCHRRLVVADLATDWASPLTAAGFDPTAPTLWIAEGLLAYLDPDDVARLADTVTELSAPGSRAGLTIGRARGEGRDPDRVADVYHEIRALWRDPQAFDVVEALEKHGWQSEQTTGAEVLQRLGRLAAPDDSDHRPAHGRLISAVLPG